MVQVQGWLDRLPASVRHAVIVFGGSALGKLGQTIVDAGGVTGVAWGDALTAALNAAAVATVLAAGVLTLTPATRQYGLFKAPAAV